MTLLSRRTARVTFMSVALVAITACGGGSTQPPTPAYSIGGTVSGINAGQSVVLQNNGGDDLTVSVNGAFTFPTRVIVGAAYAVTISSVSGTTCTVTGDSGTVSANVRVVAVVCVGDSTAPSSPADYTVGGRVSGLVGQGLELEIVNPANTAHHAVVLRTISISGNGIYRTGRAPDGYGVFVRQQPHSPTQQCVVRNNLGSFLFGPMKTDVTDADVTCGEVAYTTDSAGGTILTFSVDAISGTLAPVGSPITVDGSPYATAITPDKKYLYAGDRNSNQISVFAVDGGNGTLTPVPGSSIAAGKRPQALSVYAAVTVGYGPPVVSFFLYVANADSDDLSAYQVDRTTGIPAPLSPASYAIGTSPSATAVHPHGPFLYAANTGGSKHLSAFMIDSYTGGLTPVTGSPYATDSGLGSLAFGVDGKYLYASGTSSNAAAIYAFSVDPDSGALLGVTGSPYSLSSCDYIRTDQSGNYLYAIAGTNLLAYMIDPNTGALAPLPGFPIAIGADSHSISIDPTNQFLYVRNGADGTIAGFELDSATGTLTLMSNSPFAVGVSADFVATY